LKPNFAILNLGVHPEQVRLFKDGQPILVFCFYFFSFLWLYPYICCLLYFDSFGLYSCMYLIC